MEEDQNQQRYQHQHRDLMIDSSCEITVCLKSTYDDRGPEVLIERYDIENNMWQCVDNKVMKLDVEHGLGRFVALKLCAPLN